MAIARILMTPPLGLASPLYDDLLGASAAVESLEGLMDGPEMHRLRADLLETAALAATALAPLAAKDTKILAIPLEEQDLRLAAEAEYRVCARQAPSDDERYELVDRANQIRPMPWV